jgi:hypothetical protein
MIPASNAWGPFRFDLDPADRLARLRCLHAVAHPTMVASAAKTWLTFSPRSSASSVRSSGPCMRSTASPPWIAGTS